MVLGSPRAECSFRPVNHKNFIRNENEPNPPTHQASYPNHVLGILKSTTITPCLSVLPKELFLHISTYITEQATLKNVLVRTSASTDSPLSLSKRIISNLDGIKPVKIFTSAEIFTWQGHGCGRHFTTALHDAVVDGRLTAIRLLQDTGANTLTAEYPSLTSKPRSLLEVQPHPTGNAVVSEALCAISMSAVHLASLLGSAKLVRYVRQRGEAVDVLDANRLSQFTPAARKFRIRTGMLHPHKNTCKTPLAYALGRHRGGYQASFREVGVEIPEQGTEEPRTREVVELWLDAGADDHLGGVLQRCLGRRTLEWLGQTHQDLEVRKMSEGRGDL
ncbi:unnamed protein product [Diplocarpon coronariae]